MATIYIIRNTINKKEYIGQTVQKLQKRFNNHLKYRKNVCSALYSAILKYGKENFYIEELLSGDFTKPELNELEMFYIETFNTVSPNGYNLQTGGNSFRMHESSNKQISETMKGRKILWGAAISKTMTDKWADPVYRAQMVAKHTGKRGYKYKNKTMPKKLNLDEDYIKELHKQGNTINKIAKIMGVSFNVIKIRL
jgi:group I intron endonuclease